MAAEMVENFIFFPSSDEEVDGKSCIELGRIEGSE